MRRGLIQTQEVNGVSFETGPHAILLSDSSIQNGHFSNMGEFPVLQMMYRQGMILPNHPGNTGRKPLLIGAKQQIKHQMEYIHRGNYGLVSEEEIVSAGYQPDEAKHMMALKLKFAFGKIRNPEELLDTLVIGYKKTEVLEGLFIERLRHNVFEISYGDDRVTVDLNLSPDQDYAIPYALNHHNINREYFAVIHSGEGDGWDILRPSMSSILMFQGKIYLIDAGPNIHHILNHLGIGINEIDGIFHTHSHDDHFAGLTTMMKTDKKVKYFSTPLVRSSVVKKLTSLLGIPEESFFNFFEPIDLTFDEWNDIAGLEVRPTFSPHPVETNIFEFRTLWEHGYLSYAHLADITSRKVLDGMVQEGTSLSEDWVDGIYEHYLTPHCIKKLDIGGGMIHGQAEDFKLDESKKIILAHTSLELNSVQKGIGSGSPFGTVDVLIESLSNVLRHQAKRYLRMYFPDVPKHELNVLLNFPIVCFNPESILIKGGEANQHIYLVVTGNVEMIEANSEMHSIVSAGALIGEFSGMIGVSIEETYRTESFVNVLKIPGQLYYEFVKQNNLYRSIEEMSDKRWFLQRTWLFGESISTPIQNQVAGQTEEVEFPEGPLDLSCCEDCVLLILEGEVDLGMGQYSYKTLGQGDVLGEEVSFFNFPPLLDAVAKTKVLFYRIPYQAISNIPIVRFKLRETYESKVVFYLDHAWPRLEEGEGIPMDDLGHLQIDIRYRRVAITVMRYIDMMLKDTSKSVLDLGMKKVKLAFDRLYKLEEYLQQNLHMHQYDAHVAEHAKMQKLLSTISSEKKPWLSREEAIAFFEPLIQHRDKHDRELIQDLNKRGIY